MLHRRYPKQINFRHPDIQLIVKEDDVTMIIIVFTLAIVLLIVSISKWGVHPFLAIMGIALALAVANRNSAGDHTNHNRKRILVNLCQHWNSNHTGNNHRAHT